MGASLWWTLTVKIATQTVARMKPFEDRYSSNQGFLRASLSARSASCAMIQFLREHEGNSIQANRGRVAQVDKSMLRRK